MFETKTTRNWTPGEAWDTIQIIGPRVSLAQCVVKTTNSPCTSRPHSIRERTHQLFQPAHLKALRCAAMDGGIYSKHPCDKHVGLPLKNSIGGN